MNLSTINFEPKNWQAELSESFRRVADLLDFLQLDCNIPDIDQPFPFLVTRSFAGRMSKNNPNDPLLRQVLPSIDETLVSVGFIKDPVGDLLSQTAPGLLHKYRGRVLILTTGACAIHCRYCFRREFPYQDHQLTKSIEDQTLSYIKTDRSIEEVILSGGDALLLSDEKLRELLQKIDSIQHIKRIRIHSRIPVVLPSRITKALLKNLERLRSKVILVIHTNHAQEIDASVGIALKNLKKSGIYMLNQTVLLKGINDSVEVLKDLSEALFEQEVMPYYIHLLDKAIGTAHFDIPKAQALDLYDHLRKTLPGYLVPKLVHEESGKPYKTLVTN